MRRGTHPQGVPVSLVLYPEHRAALWTLQMRHGYASMSAVVRGLIRIADREVEARLRAFLPDSHGKSNRRARPQRPSVLLHPHDVEQLDRLAEAAGASSRSAVVRFLIHDAAAPTATRREIHRAATTGTDAA